ncbi:hypothetical protein OA867_03060 [Prochlorococcus sp. AH-716-D22]|nr:hypothetical protein [Prochlorococcus sp. AH-716-D22]
MKRIEQIVVIFIAAALAIPSYWFFWTLAGGGGYNKRITPVIEEGSATRDSLLKTSSSFDQP